MKQALFYLTMSLLMIVSYQNCSGYFSTGGVFSSLECGASVGEMAPIFRTTFQPIFLKNDCARCHAPGGEKSDSPFADQDSFAAVSVFQNIGGPIAVEEKLAAGHQGYNYQAIKPELDEAKNNWYAQGFGQCSTGLFTTTENRVNFFEPVADPDTGNFKVAADAINAPETMTWDLDEESFEPKIPGASVSVQLEVVPDQDGFAQFYVVRNILFSSPRMLEVKGVRVLLNGQSYNQNTWASAGGFVIGDNAPLEGATGSIQIFKGSGEKYTRTDGWSISFDSIQEQ